MRLSYKRICLPDRSQTPPITDHFRVLPPGSKVTTGNPCGPGECSSPPEPEERSAPSEPIVGPCQHLRGSLFQEYILRTQTRTLGGISPTFRGRAVRCLFPYKPFPPLKVAEDDDAEDMLRPLPVSTVLEMPEDGNKVIEEKGWTQSEQGRLDEMLKAYARWEVDYAHRFIKAKACTGVTSNRSGVCDACEDLAENDKAFKKGMYRVSPQ